MFLSIQLKSVVSETTLDPSFWVNYPFKLVNVGESPFFSVNFDLLSVVYCIRSSPQRKQRGEEWFTISKASPTCLIWTMWRTSTPSMQLIMETSLILSTTA